MRSYVFAALLGLIAVVFLGSQLIPSIGRAEGGGDPPLGELSTSTDQSGPQLAPGQIVVRFRDGASQSAIAALNASHAAQTIAAQPLSGLHRLSVSADADLDHVLAAYRNSPLVEEAGPSYIARAMEAPDDTNYSFQWDLHDTVGGMWAESAWDLSSNGGQGVVVAVIDTGAAYEDFTGVGGLNIQTFKQAPDLAQTTFVAPYDFYNNDDHANDDNGHGSHVTGTITQDTNNAYGVAGVAPNSTIMPVKALDFSGNGFDADVVESIYYAVNNGADVINMSLAFPNTGTPDANGVTCTEIIGMNAALDFAYASGVTVVAAAGNGSASTVSCPAAHPTTIAVGATRFDGQAAFYSNGGLALNLTAPGGDPNVDQNNDGFSDGVVQETYCFDYISLLFTGIYDTFCDIFMAGTSMATPHVTGTVALLLGEDPTLTPDEVLFYLESTATDRGAAGWDATYGWGALNAHAALAALLGVSPPAPTPTPTVEPPAPGEPDLVQTALSDIPTSKKAGGKIRVTDTVENAGLGVATASSTRFYLSTDAQWDAGDALLSGTRAVAELAAGATSSGTTRVGIPEATAAGVYYLIVCADDAQSVVESDETNNCLASATTIEITGGGGGGGNGGGPPPGRGKK